MNLIILRDVIDRWGLDVRLSEQKMCDLLDYLFQVIDDYLSFFQPTSEI
jgi:hypothetical protein